MTALAIDAAGVATLARACFGEPNRALSTARELRFGRRGSIAVVPDRGVWQDHEAGQGGGVLDMLVHAGAARTRRDAARLLESEGRLEPRERPREAARRARDAEQRQSRRRAWAARLWASASPFAHSLAETYLRRARAITAPLGGAHLRFHPAAPLIPYYPPSATAPAMVARVQGPDGRRHGRSPHLPRARWPRQGGGSAGQKSWAARSAVVTSGLIAGDRARRRRGYRERLVGMAGAGRSSGRLHRSPVRRRHGGAAMARRRK